MASIYFEFKFISQSHQWCKGVLKVGKMKWVAREKWLGGQTRKVKKPAWQDFFLLEIPAQTDIKKEVLCKTWND